LLIPTLDVLALGLSVVVMHLRVTPVKFPVGAAYALIALIVLIFTGSYQPRIQPRLSEDVAALMGKLSAAGVLTGLVLHPKVLPHAPTVAQFGALLTRIPLAVLLVLAARAFAYFTIREARSGGYLTEPTLIIGARNLGVKVATTLGEHPELGLLPVGFLDSIGGDGLPFPVLGVVNDLEVVVKALGVRRVIVAFGGMREAEMVKILRASDQLPVEVHVVPRFYELGVAPEGPLTDDLWGITIQRLRRSALRSVAWRTKRAFDLVLATLFLVLTLPLLAACAAAVRLSSPGPIFFTQRRIGQRGEIFHLLKFRTMRVNDDSDTTWTVTDEERITTVGRFLRGTSMDELPQLVNVLRGEMSLVGPRPERPHFVDQFRVAVQGYDDRHRVPAGLTGWAQVHGLRGDTSIADRALFDNYYVEHWSLWHDILILLRTAGQVLKRGGR